MNQADLLRRVLESYALPLDGYHGVRHWARVLENGLQLCEQTGADREVVTLFALFHDSRRVNEGRDRNHGLRGGEFARTFRGNGIDLDDERFELLFEACRLHTGGEAHTDVTVQTCWDADRLDLGRVGIQPNLARLCTAAARDLIAWSHPRAIRNHEPEYVIREWGLCLPTTQRDNG